MDNKEIQDEEKPCMQSTQGITQKDFENFLIERNIDIANTDKGQLFETFLLFQKFMSCMLSTTGIAQPKNEPENVEEDKKSIIEKEEKNSNKDDEVNLDNIDNVIETNINKDDIHSEENTKEHNEEIKQEHEELMENDNKTQSENEIHISTNNDNKEQEASHNNNIVNYDEIPIKPVDVNFVELVEKNLAELKYTPDNRDSSCEPKFKYKKKSAKNQKITKRNKSNERPQNKTVSHISKSKKTNISTTRSAVIKNKFLQSKSMNNKPNENFDENDTINEDDSIIINKPITQTQNIYLGLNKEEEKNNSLNIVEPIDDVNEATISNSEVIYNDSMTEDEDIKDEANEHCNAINIQPTPYTNKIHIKPKTNKNIILKNQFEKELKILKEEKNEVAKLKAEYIKMKKKLNKDMEEFSLLKQKEFNNFEKWKQEEIKKLKKSNQNNNNTNSNSNSKKEKEIIEQLKNQLARTQDEIKKRENVNKVNIDKLKKQLTDANNQISQLIKINSTKRTNNNYYSNKDSFNQLQPLTTSNNSTSNLRPVAKSESFPLKKSKKPNELISSSKSTLKASKKRLQANPIKKEDNDEYSMVFPPQYILTPFTKVISEEKLQDGKTVKIYSNKAKEIIFPSGVKKQIFPDGYQIIFFNNKDIKQIYPDNKIVYSFYEAKTIETSFPNGVHIYKLQNGQIEKHYPDGFKEIVYPSGEIKLINQNGTESLKQNKNGKIYERQNTNYDNNGALIIQREDGTKEIKFPSGAEIFEFA